MFRGEGGEAEHLGRTLNRRQFGQFRIYIRRFQRMRLPVTKNVSAQPFDPVVGTGGRGQHFKAMLFMFFLFFVVPVGVRIWLHGV